MTGPNDSQHPQQWYYARDGRQTGPVSSEQIKQLAASGDLVPDDLVWKEGMTTWAHARSVNGLFSAPSPAVPPPLPPSSTSGSERVPLGATSSSPCQIAAQPATEKDGEDDDSDMDDDDWETDEALLSNSVHGTYREWLEANVGDRIGVWKEKATRGVSWAQWLLALCFEEGIGVRQDDAAAMEWLRKSAEQEWADLQGFAAAQAMLGCRYLDGVGVPANETEAIRWYRKAAEQENGGGSLARYYLGRCYEDGRGVPQDTSEAAKLYRQAADNVWPADENAAAQLNLGHCYWNGKGVPQNYAEAVKWFRKAAERGLADAQVSLGKCYRDGQGVPQDFAEAVNWLRKAAEQGVAAAQSEVAFLYNEGRGVPQNCAEAMKWFHKAAEQGDVTAQFNLGFCYFNGKGVSRNPRRLRSGFAKPLSKAIPRHRIAWASATQKAKVFRMTLMRQ